MTLPQCPPPSVGYAASGSVIVLVGAVAVALLALLAGGTYLIVRRWSRRRFEAL